MQDGVRVALGGQTRIGHFPSKGGQHFPRQCGQGETVHGGQDREPDNEGRAGLVWLA